MTVHKAIVISVVLILCLASSSSAMLIQDQLMTLGAANGVFLGGVGFNNATSINILSGFNTQRSSSANGQVLAFQHQDGTHFQVAFAAGEGGVFGVDQLGNSIASQAELVDGQNAQLDQNLDVVTHQGMAANGGVGYVGAIDGYVGHQVQVTLGRDGMNMNITKVNVLETGQIHQF